MQFMWCEYNRQTISALSIFGLWPFQPASQIRPRAVTTALLTTGVLFVQILRFFTATCDFEMAIKLAAFILTTLLYVIRFYAFFMQGAHVKVLTEETNKDWVSLSEKKDERLILEHYAYMAKMVTVVTTLLLTGPMMLVLGLQLVSYYLNIVCPLNETREYFLPVVAEFFVDQVKYFWPISIYLDIGITMGMLILIYTEGVFIIFAAHACALFNITGRRIQNAIEQCRVNISNKSPLMVLADAIYLHKRAFEYCEILSTKFSLYYFGIYIVCVISLSMNIFRMFWMLSIVNDMSECILSVFIVIGHLWCLFVSNQVGQSLIDHSNEILNKTYDSSWYATPLAVQKLVLFVMTRCFKTYKFVAYLIVPSLEGYASMLNVAFSYFMMLHTASPVDK